MREIVTKRSEIGRIRHAGWPKPLRTQELSPQQAIEAVAVLLLQENGELSREQTLQIAERFIRDAVALTVVVGDRKEECAAYHGTVRSSKLTQPVKE